MGLLVEVRRHHSREYLRQHVGKAEEDDAADDLLDIHVDIVPILAGGGLVAEATNEERQEQDGSQQPEEVFLQARNAPDSNQDWPTDD